MVNGSMILKNPIH